MESNRHARKEKSNLIDLIRLGKGTEEQTATNKTIQTTSRN
jgi:hypothetical protein